MSTVTRRYETNMSSFHFFFNDTATTEIYTLSLHDALPICGILGHGLFDDFDQLLRQVRADRFQRGRLVIQDLVDHRHRVGDRKSTRLNSSHQIISYAVFCLKKKKYESHEQTHSGINHTNRP